MYSSSCVALLVLRACVCCHGACIVSAVAFVVFVVADVVLVVVLYCTWYGCCLLNLHYVLAMLALHCFICNTWYSSPWSRKGVTSLQEVVTHALRTRSPASTIRSQPPPPPPPRYFHAFVFFSRAVPGRRHPCWRTDSPSPWEQWGRV